MSSIRVIFISTWDQQEADCDLDDLQLTSVEDDEIEHSPSTLNPLGTSSSSFVPNDNDSGRETGIDSRVSHTSSSVSNNSNMANVKGWYKKQVKR